MIIQRKSKKVAYGYPRFFQFRLNQYKMKYLSHVLNLIERFIEGKLSTIDFETKYLSLWRKARDDGSLSELNEVTEGALDKLFTAVDVYCPNEELRDEFDINEAQLLNVAKITFNKLNVVARQVRCKNW